MQFEIDVYNYYTPHLDKAQYGLKIPPMIYLIKFTARHNNESFVEKLVFPLASLYDEFNRTGGFVCSRFFDFRSKKQGISLRTAYENFVSIAEDYEEDTLSNFLTSVSGMYLLSSAGFSAAYTVQERNLSIWYFNGSFTMYKNFNNEEYPLYEISKEGTARWDPKELLDYCENRLDALFDMLQQKNLKLIMQCEPFSLKI